MKWRPVIKRFESLFLSRNAGGHGVHSPYLYRLITGIEAARDRGGFAFREVGEYRGILKGDRSEVVITDYGTGKGGARRVCEIARLSSVSPKYASVLAFLARWIEKGTIVELGTSLGLSSMTMGLANRRVRVVTVEGSPELSQRASEACKYYGVDNVEVLTGEFDLIIKRYDLNRSDPKMVFIDGNHTEDATIRYFEYFLPDASCERIIIIDDIDYSSGMNRAWRKMKSDARVAASVDAGRLGLLIFRCDGFSGKNFRIGY